MISIRKYMDILNEASERDLMRGGCYALALWLHRKTKLPLYGLFDDDDYMHHAFVYDATDDRAYDARGGLSLKNIQFYRRQESAGRHTKPTTAEAVAQYVEEIAFERGPISNAAIAAFVRRQPDLLQLIRR